MNDSVSVAREHPLFALAMSLRPEITGSIDKVTEDTTLPVETVEEAHNEVIVLPLSIPEKVDTEVIDPPIPIQESVDTEVIDLPLSIPEKVDTEVIDPQTTEPDLPATPEVYSVPEDHEQECSSDEDNDSSDERESQNGVQIDIDDHAILIPDPIPQVDPEVDSELVEWQSRMCPECPGKQPFKTVEALKMHMASKYHKRRRAREAEAAKDPGAVPKPGGRKKSRKNRSKDNICPQCPNDRSFKSASALKMHLNSERHKQKANGDRGVVRTVRTGYLTPTTEPENMENEERRYSNEPDEQKLPIGNIPETSMPTPPTTPPTINVFPAVQCYPTPFPSLRFEEPPTTEEIITTIAAAVANTPTVTFPMEMLKSIDTDISSTQILILSPTREMAVHVENRLSARCTPLGISCYACVGGSSVREDISRLGEGAHIVSGTVGRVLMALQNGWLNMEYDGLLILNKETEILKKQWREYMAELYLLLGEDTRLARASSKMPVT